MSADSIALASAPDGSGDAEFDRLLGAREVRAVFQPLVELASGVVVGYEALARGPVDTVWESPAALFEAGYRLGRVAELDWACRAAAFGAAMRAGLHPDLTLFVNSEPVSMGVACPADLQQTVSAAESRLRVVMEVTERAVAADPAGLLRAVNRARDVGWGVALDDIGAEPASLAVMPFVQPDVIKLDLRLIQGRTTAEVAGIVNAVLAQAERAGAAVLAEGIETAQHVEVALSMGATLGQGWRFGRPAPLPDRTCAPDHVVRLHPARDPAGPTPYQVVAAHRPTARAAKHLLLPMSMHLEYKGLGPGEPIVLLACFQEARHFTPSSRQRFARLAHWAAFTGAVGVGMPPVPTPGVYGAELAADDPLRGEWDVIAIGPHFAGALVARDCGDTGSDAERRFDFAVTHDRDLVIQAAQTLLAKLVPPSRLDQCRVTA